MIRIPLASVYAGLATAGTTAAGSLIENHDISLGTAAAVGGVVFTGVWWLSRHLQKVSDRLDEGERRFTKLESQLDVLGTKLDNLPCREANCKPADSKKK